MVAGLSLLDAIVQSPSTYDSDSPAERQVHMANELVAAALDEHRHIEAIDTCGLGKKNRRYLAGPNAPLFRKMHEDWLTGAETLLARVQSMRETGQIVGRLDELQDAVALARGLLSFTMEMIELGLQRIRNGDFVTLDEVRHGLRAQAHK